MSKLKTALAIGACLLAVGTTTALVGNVYKEEIKDWWTETFEQEKEDKKEYNYLDEYAETGEIEDLVLTAEKIKDNVFSTNNNHPILLYGCLSLPNCVEVGEESFYEQSGLESLYLPKVEVVKHYAFRGVSVLTSKLSLPNIIKVEQEAFYELGVNDNFVLDLGEKIESIGNYGFVISGLETIIIRNPNKVVEMGNGVFDQANICYEEPGGVLYVPDNLLEEYKANANVLANVGNNPNKIKPLSEYQE